MKHPKYLLTALVLVVFAGGALGLVIWNESKPAALTSGSSTQNNDATTYTLAQIAEHGDETSCWAAIEGKVYDLTPFIEEHPGGSRSILVICGSDGTGSFNSMPSAVIPAARAALAKYRIGTLAE